MLGRRFTKLRDAADLPEATLHRLRHSLATLLVSRGEILPAQERLGHADAATTLREYSHALPGSDRAIADYLNGLLDPTTFPLPGLEEEEDGPGQGGLGAKH